MDEKLDIDFAYQILKELSLRSSHELVFENGLPNYSEITYWLSILLKMGLILIVMKDDSHTVIRKTEEGETFFHLWNWEKSISVS